MQIPARQLQARESLQILGDRPYLDATTFRTRNPRCDLDFLVQVPGLD